MIILYGNHCPKCNILEKKLRKSNIQFEYCDDKAFMYKRGFDFMPVLEVNGQVMNFSEAVKWVNERN